MKTLLSLTFTLSVLFAVSQPIITANPQSKSNCVDSCFYLRVAAVGNGLTYHWQRDEGSGFVNLNLPSANSDTLWVCDTGIVAPASLIYRCAVVDQNNDSAISNSATVSTDSCFAPTADFTYAVNGTEICFTSTSQDAVTVLWNFGDGNTSNLEDPCNDYGTAWIYDITLYVFNDYGSDTLKRTIDMVGVAELHSQFKMFPNPVADEFHIIGDLIIDNYSLYNSQGQLVAQSAEKTSRAIIDLSGFDAGIYTLVVTSGNQFLNHKIAKN